MKYFFPRIRPPARQGLTSKQNRINNAKRYQVMRSVNKKWRKKRKFDDKPEEENIETLRRSRSRPPESESIKRNVSLYKGHCGKRCGSKNWLNQIREIIKKTTKRGLRVGWD